MILLWTGKDDIPALSVEELLHFEVYAGSLQG